MGGVPSVPTDPSRTIQVIGAGYSRTGTVSMQMALEKLLDGPVMHGGTALLGREDAYCKKWLEVYEAHAAGDRPRKLKALREATRGFVGICDLPGNNFIEELVELYPDAKVVAVHRDADRWWKSIELIIKNTTPRWLKYYLAPVPGWRHFPKMVEWFTYRGEEILTTEVEGVTDPQNIGKDLLAVHNRWVASFVPPEKFLLMELKDGWEPLCEFLDKPVPDEPFPRANDAAAVEQTAKDIMTKTALVWLGIFATTGAAGYAAFKLWEAYL